MLAHRDDNGVLQEGLGNGDLYALWQHCVYQGVMKSHNYTGKEIQALYCAFKDAYMTGGAGYWYLNLFRFHNHSCTASLNALIFNALREKSTAAKIRHAVYPQYMQHPCYQEYI